MSIRNYYRNQSTVIGDHPLLHPRNDELITDYHIASAQLTVVRRISQLDQFIWCLEFDVRAMWRQDAFQGAE